MRKQKISYDEMINLLQKQQYKAPDQWPAIEQEFDLNDSVSQLPQHKAPDGLWAGIEVGLDEGIEKEELGRKHNWFLLAAVALIIALLLFILTVLSPKAPEQQYQYKSEIEKTGFQENIVQLDDQINDVLNYIESNSFLYDDERLQEFKAQLEEINMALQQLNAMQDNYGTDEPSQQLMAKMEREKASLLKSMINNS